MVVNGMKNPQRLARVFKKPTQIVIQVRTAVVSVQIGHNETEASNANDGLQLTQANTSTNFPGARMLWQGELWYSASADNTLFSVVIDEATPF